MPTSRSNSAKVAAYPCRGQQIVAGSNRMTGVQADGEAVRKTAPLDDGLQVGKAETEISPLPGGVLQQNPPLIVRSQFYQFIKCLDNPFQSRFPLRRPDGSRGA